MNNKTKKILIVEDDRKTREGLIKAFKKEGIIPLGAKTGKEAVEIAFAEKPELILLDIILPGMHGVEVINKLQADRWGREVPVIILTNFPEYPGLPDYIANLDYEIASKEKNKLWEVVKKVKEKLGLLKRRQLAGDLSRRKR